MNSTLRWPAPLLAVSLSASVCSLCPAQPDDPRDLLPDGMILPDAVTSPISPDDPIAVPMSPRLALADGEGTIELHFRGSWADPMGVTSVKRGDFRMRCLIVAGVSAQRSGPKAQLSINRSKIDENPEWAPEAEGRFFDARYALYANDHGLYVQFGNEVRVVPFGGRSITGAGEPVHLVLVMRQGVSGEPHTEVYLDGARTNLENFGLRAGGDAAPVMVGGMPAGAGGYVMFPAEPGHDPVQIELIARGWDGEIGGVRIWSEPYSKEIVGGVPSKLRMYSQSQVERSVRMPGFTGGEAFELPDVGELIAMSDFHGERERHHVRLVDPIGGNWYLAESPVPAPAEPLPGFDHAFGNFTSYPMVTIVPNVVERLLYVDGILAGAIFDDEKEGTLRLEWMVPDWRWGVRPRSTVDVISGVGDGNLQKVRIGTAVEDAALAQMSLPQLNEHLVEVQGERTRIHNRLVAAGDDTGRRDGIARERDEFDRTRLQPLTRTLALRRFQYAALGIASAEELVLTRPDPTWTGGTPKKSDNEFIQQMIPLVTTTGCGAFDVTEMDPFYFGSGKRGSTRYLLSPPGEDDFKLTAEKLVAPTWFLTYRLPGVAIDSSSTTTSSDKQRMLGLSASVGMSLRSPAIGNFKANAKGSYENDSGQGKESLSTMVSTVARDFALVFDKANARLDPIFIRDVERVRDGELSPRQFVEDIGTHYAYATTYGGLGFLERTMDKQVYNEAISWGFDVEAEMNIGATDAKTGVMGGGFGVSGGMGMKNQNKWNELFQTDKSKLTVIGSGNSITFNADMASYDVSDPWPVFLDLRPIYELITPAYFDDPRIYHEVRALIRDATNAYLTEAAATIDDTEPITPRPRRQMVKMELKLTMVKIDNGGYIIDFNTEDGLTASQFFEALGGSVDPRVYKQDDPDGTAELAGTVSVQPFGKKADGTRDDIQSRPTKMLTYSKVAPLEIPMQLTRRAKVGDSELVPMNGWISVSPDDPDIDMPSTPLLFDVWVNADMDGDGRPDSDNITVHDPSRVSFAITVKDMLEVDDVGSDEELTSYPNSAPLVMTPEDLADGYHEAKIPPVEEGDPTVTLIFTLTKADIDYPLKNSKFASHLRGYEMLATAGPDTPMPGTNRYAACVPFSGRWTDVGGITPDRLDVYRADGRLLSGYRTADDRGRAGSGTVHAAVAGDYALALHFCLTDAMDPAGDATTLLDRADGTLRVAFEETGLVLHSGSARLPLPLAGADGKPFALSMLRDLPPLAGNPLHGHAHQRTMWTLGLSFDPASREVHALLRDEAGRLGAFTARAQAPSGFTAGTSPRWRFGSAKHPPCRAVISGMMVWHDAMPPDRLATRAVLARLGQAGSIMFDEKIGTSHTRSRYREQWSQDRSSTEGFSELHTALGMTGLEPGVVLFERAWAAAGLPTLPPDQLRSRFAAGKDSTAPPMLQVGNQVSFAEWLDTAFADADPDPDTLRVPAGARRTAAALADLMLAAHEGQAADGSGELDVTETLAAEAALVTPALRELAYARADRGKVRAALRGDPVLDDLLSGVSTGGSDFATMIDELAATEPDLAGRVHALAVADADLALRAAVLCGTRDGKGTVLELTGVFDDDEVRARELEAVYGSDREIVRLFAALTDKNTTCNRYELAALCAFRLAISELILTDEAIAGLSDLLEVGQREYGLRWHGWRVRHGGPFAATVTALNGAQTRLGLPLSDILVVRTETGATFEMVGEDGDADSLRIDGLPDAIRDDEELAAQAASIIEAVDTDGDGTVTSDEMNAVLTSSGPAADWFLKPKETIGHHLWAWAYATTALAPPGTDLSELSLTPETLMLFLTLKRELLVVHNEAPAPEEEADGPDGGRLPMWILAAHMLWERRALLGDADAVAAGVGRGPLLMR